MTDESKILFEQLIEAINSPDWWMIVLTIINILAFVFVAYTQIRLQKQQNKLQEQQIRQQEYDVYRRIYTQIFDVDICNKALLLRIVAILTNNEDKILRLKLIEDVWNEYEKLSDDFSEWTLDLDLKKCGEAKDVKYYYDASQAGRKVLQMFKYFVENELLVFNPLLANNVPMEHTTPPEKFIDIILALYRGRNSQLLRNELLAYAQIVEKTNQAQLLKVIKDHIAPTDTK